MRYSQSRKRQSVELKRQMLVYGAGSAPSGRLSVAPGGCLADGPERLPSFTSAELVGFAISRAKRNVE